MSQARFRFSVLMILVSFAVGYSSPAPAAETAGLVGEWRFDEGQGDIVRDSSGNGHDGKLKDAHWIKQGDGSAIQFQGIGGCVDCGETSEMNLNDSITLEAWFKPKATNWTSPNVIGVTKGVFQLIYTDRGQLFWFAGPARYDVGNKVPLGEWSHVVAVIEGKQRRLFINGLLVAKADSDTAPGKGGHLLIGSEKQPFLNGSLDHVRLYNRTLSAAEAMAHFKTEAPQYGWDPTLFQEVKITPYYYFERGEIVVEADYRGLQPLPDNSRLEIWLANQNDQLKKLTSATLEKLPEVGTADVALSLGTLAPGSYVIGARLTGPDVAMERRVKFDHPMRLNVPSPSEKVVAQPPARPAQPPFSIRMPQAGGFELSANGTSYPFQTRISWPNGKFNQLTTGDTAAGDGEKSWKTRVSTINDKEYELQAGGDYYQLHRRVTVSANHVDVLDTYTNTTDSDLGLIIYNELPIKPGELTASRLCGYEGGGRVIDGMAPHYGGASIFLKQKNSGIGMLPLDDVYVIQSVMYIEKEMAGMGTERLCLAPKGSHTLHWVIYPTGSGDYWDFINTFRKTEGRIGTVEGAAGFISFGPMNRRQAPDQDFIKNRRLKYVIMSCLSRSEDDPGVSIEGIEFMDFPKEMQRVRDQATVLHTRYPGIKVCFHNAHTLYATDKPERFADSRIITASGTPASSGGGPPYFSDQRGKAGWRWYTYYPTPGNSFHRALMKSVDVMMDEMGVDGVFVDGFMLGYGGRWTYDRWDGFSAQIDPDTKTIQKKIGSVLLLMQPSMVEYARKIHDKGGFVIANGSIMTDTIAREKYILCDAECQAGPESHLAPSVLSLSLGPFANDKDIYLDILDKLRWGVLYMPYNERINLKHPTLGSMQFPMTFEEIGPGIVRGKERIVTMNPGAYDWPNDNRLHLVHKFDSRGAPAMNTFVTTSDRYGVRTELNFATLESAVIERVPASIESAEPVNVIMRDYDGSSISMLVNGRGDAKLNLFVGTSYPDKRDGVITDGGTNPATISYGDDYRVTIGENSTTIKELDGTLAVPLKLNGQTEVHVEPVKRAAG